MNSIKHFAKAMAIISALFTGGSLQARHLEPAVPTLMQAMRLLDDALMDVQHGSNYQAEQKIRGAYYKARMAKNDLRYQNYRASEAVEVAIDKLSDHYLDSLQKIQWGIDCLGAATIILAKQSYSTQAAKVLIRVGMFTAKTQNFQRSLQALRAAKQKIQGHGRGPQKAKGALGVAIDKAQDQMLSAAQKTTWVIDCARKALQFLQQGSGSYPQPRPRPNPGPQYPVNASCTVDIGGNFFFPKTNVKCNIHGQGVKGYEITVNGNTTWIGNLNPRQRTQGFTTDKKKVGGHSVQYQVWLILRSGQKVMAFAQ
jgi:hypothetical protein